MTGENASPFVMAKWREGLMSTSKVMTRQDGSKGEGWFANEPREQPPKFSHAEGNHHWKIRRWVDLDRAGGFWLGGLECLLRLFLSIASSVTRKAIKKAMASMESVTWRNQPWKVRTSSSSRPTSPLASSKHCSTVHRT